MLIMELMLNLCPDEDLSETKHVGLSLIQLRPFIINITASQLMDLQALLFLLIDRWPVLEEHFHSTSLSSLTKCSSSHISSLIMIAFFIFLLYKCTQVK